MIFNIPNGISMVWTFGMNKSFGCLLPKAKATRDWWGQSAGFY